MRRKALGILLLSLMAFLAACGSSGSSKPSSSATPAPSTSSSGSSSTTPAAPAAQSGPVKGGKLIVGMTYEPVTLDPHVTGQAIAIRILIQTHDALLYADDKGQIHPSLAESYTISPDGLTYTFKLRKDVKFTDGTPFNAQAVKFSWERIMDPKTASQSAVSALKPLKTVEAVDPSTVKATLSEPSAVWLRNVAGATLAPVSPDAVAKLGDKFARTPVGIGPYMIKEWKEKESVTLVRTPGYKSITPGFKNKGEGYLDEIIFKFIPENQVRFATLENGETNAIEDVPSKFVALVEKDTKKFTMLKVPYAGSPRQFMINTQTFPTTDLAVRQAILHAVNGEAIIKTMHDGVFPPGNGPMNASTPMSTKGVYRKFYPFDLNKAKSLLEAAGWKAGSDGIRVKDGKRLEIIANVLADVPEYGELTQVVQAQLREIGMDVKLKSLARSPWYDSNAKGDYNIVGMALWSTDPDMLRTLYRTKGSVFIWSHYENPDYDKIVDEAVKLTDNAKRQALYTTAQEILMKDAVVLPVWDQMNLLAVHSNIKGIAFDQNAYPRYYDTYMEKK